MNLRQFECLRAIMTTGSMTQAARLIGVSQPSASLISNLEHSLGFRLFERVKGRLVATPEAAHFLPDVVRTLDSMDLARQKAKAIKDDKFGDLKIVAYPNIAIDFLPQSVARFLKGNRSIRIQVHARRSEMMSGLLPAMDFDLAIVTRLTEIRNFDIEEVRLPCVLAFPEDHELARRSVIRPAHIVTMPLVTLAQDHSSVTQLVEKFADTNVPYPGGSIETQTFESVAGFIRRGVGVGLLDQITAQRYAGSNIVTRTFQPAIYQSVYLLVPADRPVSRLLELFREQLLADLEECRQASGEMVSS